MNEELRIKNHESRKRAHILHYSLFIINCQFFTLHYSLFIYKGKVTLPVSVHVDI